MRDLGGASKEKTLRQGPVVVEAESFDALAEAFRAHLIGRRLSPATVKIREHGVRVLRDYVEDTGIADVRQMTRRQVDAYVAHLRGRKLSPRTIDNWIGTLKRFFAFLVESNRLLISPAEHLRQKNLSRLVGATISTEQAERLLAVPNTSLPIGIRDRAMLEVLYCTGIRRGELVALTVFDVDLAGGLLRISQAKGGGERIVPLGRQAQKWLRAYLENVRPQLGRRKYGRDGEPRLFLGRHGKPLSPEAVVMNLRKIGHKAKVPVSCHTLRRTMATEMLKGGAQLPEVAALLGHASFQTTQRYTKVASQDLRRVHAEKHPRGKK